MPTNFDAIPDELKQLKQWVLWKYVDVGGPKPTKVPFSVNDYKASVTNPNDWSTFDNVIRCYSASGYDGVGFVFSAFDPYAFIDLDPTTDEENSKRQVKIFSEFNSYSEKSPSGKGLHIIVKGSIPKGLHRADIEIYSNERYAAMTGNVFREAPIQEYHELLNQLFDQMSKPPIVYANSGLDDPQTQSDEDVIKQASNAVNGKKFIDLYSGDWQNYYPKQAAAGQGSSEADFALIDIIAFYTQNRNQIQRIFFGSELGKKNKYSTRSELVARMIERSFDQRPPKMDFDGYKIQLEEKIVGLQEQTRATSGSEEALQEKPSILFEKKSSEERRTQAMASEYESQLGMQLVSGKSSGLSGISSFKSEREIEGNINSDQPSLEQGENIKRNGEMHNSMQQLPSKISSLDQANASVAQRLEPTPHKSIDVGSNPTTSTIPFPPGLLGEIAQFIFDAAPRQVEEVAIAGAIGLMSGICGKAYNISGTGLNQYILLLAKTGRGKDAITSGIDKIMMEVKKSVPVAGEFIGPEIINSGQALTRYLSTQSSCFVSVLGEFGFTIERISHPHANSADKMLYANLLSLYSRSGFGQIFKSSIYSKKEDSVAPTESPSVTILGESNPTTFYEAIDETMILAGLLPRFLMIEYNGDRKYFNEASVNMKPSEQLINRISQLTAYCKEVVHRRSVTNVELDEQARIKMRQYDIDTTKIINTISHPAIDELWNRAHLKVLKLASICAIGINPYNPIITINELEWSIPIVERDIKSLAHKFDIGSVGKNTEENKQFEDTVRIIKEYVVKDVEYILKYKGKTELHRDKVICYSYLSERLAKMASFKNSKIGATNTLKKMIQSLIDSGLIVEIPYVERVKRKYTYLGKCYAVISVEISR